MNTDSISDWLNTRFARSCCCAPTACDTMRHGADIQDLREREHEEPEIAGGAKPAATSLPSIETNFRSVKKYATCTAMAMNIWMDIEAMCPGIEPTLRFFMGAPSEGWPK